MKRPVQPVYEYHQHERYPAVEVEDAVEPEPEILSRRDFLGKAVVAGAATAGVMTLGSEALATGKDKDKDPRKKVSIYLGRQQVGKSQMSVQRIILFTGDKKLARWVGHYRNRSGITQAVSPLLRKSKAEVLMDGKKLYRLERKVGAAVVRHYRKKTGKAAQQPDLMLVVGRYYRPRMRGRIRRPIFRRRP